MKIKSINKIILTEPKKYYDVIDAGYHHNFLIKTNESFICSHNCDEISFIKNQDIEKQKAKAYDILDTAIGGMKTRFIRNGKNPTMLALASSKRSDKSFLEQHMQKKLQSEKENVYISDGPVWEVKPEGTYKSTKFRVALGNKFLQSMVIPEDDPSDPYIEKGYKIIEVPDDFKPDFLDDIDRALCDFAGISSSSITKYISGAAVNDIKTNRIKNPFVKEILEIGNGPEDLAQYYDFFDITKIDPELRYKPLFIHLDMSVSGDMTGIAGVFIKGKKVSTPGLDQSNDLFFSLAFSVNIKAPKGRQISFDKNRNFIYWLKDKGFNIKGITSDTFQSYDTGETLRAKGYPYSVLSVDRVNQDKICIPYQYLRSTIYEKRLEIYDDKMLVSELIDLERNMDTGKIDHPQGSAKDVSDALCLHPDTEIFLLSGKKKTIKELYDDRLSLNEWVLAYDTTINKLIPVKILDVVNNGYRDKLLKLHLDNGESFICTEDHKILLRDGQYIEARDCLDKSLMPFVHEKREMFKNRYYEYVYNPNNDNTSTGIYLHKLVAESEHSNQKDLKNINKEDKEWIVIHHIDCNQLNNNPENLEYLTNTEHCAKHTALNSSDIKREQLRIANRKRLDAGTHPFQLYTLEERQLRGHNNLVKLNKSEKHRKMVSENNKKLAAQGLLSLQQSNKSHTPEANRKRQQTYKDRYNGLGFSSDIVRAHYNETCMKKYGYDNPFHSQQQQVEFQARKTHKGMQKIAEYLHIDLNDTFPLFDLKCAAYALNLSGVSADPEYLRTLGYKIDDSTFDAYQYKILRNKGTCVRSFLKTIDTDEFTYEEFSNYYDQQFNASPSISNSFKYRFSRKPTYEDIIKLGFKIYNHRVVKIEQIAGSTVYDLKLDKIHNFALSCGIFVHNCGSVYNASKHAEEYAFDYGESFKQLLEANSDSDFYDKEQFNEALNAELLTMGHLLSDGQKRVHPSNYDLGTRDYTLFDDIIIL